MIKAKAALENYVNNNENELATEIKRYMNGYDQLLAAKTTLQVAALLIDRPVRKTKAKKVNK